MCALSSVLVDMLIAKEAGDAHQIVQHVEEQLESRKGSRGGKEGSRGGRSDACRMLTYADVC